MTSLVFWRLSRHPRPPISDPLFSSLRERRLWTWSGLVTAGIYCTVAFSSILTDPLYNQGIAAAAFLFSMALIALSVVVQGFEARPRGVEIGIALGIVAVYLMVLARLTMPERTHLIEYSVLAVFAYEALLERRANGRHVPVPALIAFCGVSSVGVLDEVVQIVIPSRVFDFEDILFNCLAVLGAVGALAIVRWSRRRRDHAHIGVDRRSSSREGNRPR